MWLSPGKIKHEYPETSLPGNATGIRQKKQQLQQQKNPPTAPSTPEKQKQNPPNSRKKEMHCKLKKIFR